MRPERRFRIVAMLAVVLSSTGLTYAQKPQTPVTGQGTAGKVTKWTSATSVGDSAIVEDKFGRVGIGTDAPTTRLTVAGVVESISGGGAVGGGFKFPDGSIQRSAGLTADQAVTSVNGLRGAVDVAGTENIIVTPSGNTVVISAKGLLRVGDAVTSFNGQRGDVTFQAVTSLNELTGDVILTGGQNISVNRKGNTIEIAAADGAATTVAHDASLTGDGSAAAPLGVADSLFLSKAVQNGSVLTVFNEAGIAGGNSNGVQILVGTAPNGPGGFGLLVDGGPTDDGIGGAGVVAAGGNGSGSGARGGVGIAATGGAGLDGAADGLAGEFNGSVSVRDDLVVGGILSQKVDHPLDPANKYLVHAAVESSEVLNVYTGNVTTDARGVAVVALPDWFEAANTDLRYQLTTVGTFARATVAEKVSNNRFTIKTEVPNVEVSWLVTGVRADAAAKAAAFAPVEEKPADERGRYVAPEAFGQPADRGVFQARYPERPESAER